ncbi:uncharacterized protein LOC115632915 [Scaptodrosophila lebanonensis]|uniref:Uncharacterized protein LOC115632915 n=1 Tax=Drosophila lebanonensis TaxID=7225 RepID=A0A6J2UC75_DROLE|nr:uncharacterized protein LOC115632915 [Scaptodrosophila lebanonensis]
MSRIVYRNKFLTGSKFFGLSNELGMQEHGVYEFPNGTRYTGNFCNGRFHGSGVMEIPQPIGVIFRVAHDHGNLTQIRQMCFDDGLEVHMDIKKNKLNDSEKMTFENWDYCKDGERRFYSETLDNLEPVGPLQYKTKEGPIAPRLAANIFDLGFGRLNKYGFLLDIPGHISETNHCYIGCHCIRQWIRENCRHGPLVDEHIKQKFKGKWAREIIRNNLEATKENSQEDKPDAGCKQFTLKPNVHSRLCRRTLSEISSSSAKKTRLALGSTSDSATSFLEIKPMPSAQSQIRLQTLTPVQSKGRLGQQSRSSICHIN